MYFVMTQHAMIIKHDKKTHMIIEHAENSRTNTRRHVRQIFNKQGYQQVVLCLPGGIR